MKVFCADCKFIRVRLLSLDKCSHPRNRKSFITHQRINMPDCRLMNETGDCEYYKVKWWKLWAPKRPDQIKIKGPNSCVIGKK